MLSRLAARLFWRRTPPAPVVPMACAPLQGEVTITVRDPSGRVTARHHVANLVVNSGRIHLARLLTAETTSTPNYLELGTGTATPQASDTTLTTPVAATWHAIDVRGTYLDYYAQYEIQYGLTEAVGTWKEIGLWAGATTTAGSGTLIAKTLVNWNKSTGQTASVTWRIYVTPQP